MPPDFTLFLDENHHRTKPLLQVLTDAAVAYECHHQHFAAGTPDDIWLPFVGDKGWALLTSDTRIRHRYSERAQVVQARVRLFCFSSNNQTAVELASTLKAALPQSVSIIRNIEPPFFASIEKSGRVSLRHL